MILQPTSRCFLVLFFFSLSDSAGTEKKNRLGTREGKTLLESQPQSMHPDSARSPLSTVFLVFLHLGLTSFGGPIAHLGYFRDAFVHRRKWLSEQDYADLVALCQFLPGPASSQVGIAVGLNRSGILGAVAAWLGFTIPSAVGLVLFAIGVAKFGDGLGTGWLHGLKVVAVAVVAQALLGMGRTLCPDARRASFAVAAMTIALSFPSALAQVAVVVCGGIMGRLLLHKTTDLPHVLISPRLSRVTGAIALLLFVGLLIVLPLVAKVTQVPALQQFETFYRAGSMVFGGGHVVLPLLQAEVVPQGWVSNDAFLAGYGAAQAVPGPLFTFSAYLGAISSVEPSGWIGAGLCLVAIFLPAFLLIIGVLPFWERLRGYQTMQSAMLGVNASVVGLLLAAFYDPVWTSAIRSGSDFALAACALLLLVFWKVAPWLVVVLCAITGGII